MALCCWHPLPGKSLEAAQPSGTQPQGSGVHTPMPRLDNVGILGVPRKAGLWRPRKRARVGRTALGAGEVTHSAQAQRW